MQRMTKRRLRKRTYLNRLYHTLRLRFECIVLFIDFATSSDKSRIKHTLKRYSYNRYLIKRLTLRRH
ncbi:hypothetical protein KG091_04575 [Carnobacteriaceae bacterium zg-ZUI78]|nr:hypothetical protein [Carnobacteriaceae bacterium zg-ZUI78]